MQDAASPRFALAVRAWLENHFTGRWIWRGGQKNGLRQVHIIASCFCAAGVEGQACLLKPLMLDELQQQVRDKWNL
jgi:hypothetical protein